MAKNSKVSMGPNTIAAMCKKNEKVAIGIDLGTSTCTVGVYQNGQVEIIINEGGNAVKPIPTCFALTDNAQVANAPPQRDSVAPKDSNTPTICDMMKLIGKGYYDKDVQHEMRMVPFRVVNVEGQPALEVMCKKTDRRFTPVDISSMILLKVKEIAECLLGKKVTDAVITVPVYFNEFERQATKEAANNAGLNVLRLMNEPVAAALAYGFLHMDGKKYALVFDLGGGTLDVSVFSIGHGVFDLKATSGNTRLGGKDFDAVIVAHFAKEIRAKHGVDIMRNRQALEKLQAVSEQAKRCLSTYDNAVIRIDGLLGGLNFRSSLSRSKFEELNADLFNSTLSAVEDVLEDANVNKSEIGEIVLVGGSTKIPKIQSLLKDYFCGMELTQSINPEETIAFGAALQAAVIAKEEYEKSEEVVYDVSPISMGIKGEGGNMTVFVPRNTPLPCSITQEFSTHKDNQPTVVIQIYEGERKRANDNYHLADLELTGLPPSPKGLLVIEVTFCVDKTGIIIVTAQEKTAGVKNAIIITTNFRKISQLDEPIKDPKVDPAKEEENRSNAQARVGLEAYCTEILGRTKLLKNTNYKVVTAKATDVLRWLQQNPRATKEDVDGRHEDIQRCCGGTLALLFRRKRSTPKLDENCEPEENKENEENEENEECDEINENDVNCDCEPEDEEPDC